MGASRGVVWEPRDGEGLRPRRSPKGGGNWCWFVLELPDKIQDGLYLMQYL